LNNFDYRDPETIEELISILSENPESMLLAGGTDLINEMKEGKHTPRLVVSARKINEMKGISLDSDGSLNIGAATTLSEVVNSPLVKNFQEAISAAAKTVGSTQVRNRGTIGGNVCHASPAADTAPVLLALEAKANVEGPGGQRVIPFTEFFKGVGKTALQQGEVLKSISVPAGASGMKCLYFKLGVRKAMEITIASVAVAVSISEGYCKDIRIALGSVAPVPIRCSRTEGFLIGKKVREAAEEAAQAVKNECSPIDDIRATGEYRREMVGNLLKKALIILTAD